MPAHDGRSGSPLVKHTSSSSLQLDLRVIHLLQASYVLLSKFDVMFSKGLDKQALVLYASFLDLVDLPMSAN